MPPSKSEYEVERIVSDKCLVGRRFFLVKWRGFDSADNTWEPEENLVNCPRLVREYFGEKGLRNTKSQHISSTLMRSMKVSKTRRSSILALTSPKASLKVSRRSSVNSQATKANDLQLTKINNLQPAETKNLQLATIDELQPADANDMQPAQASDLLPPKANNVRSAEVNDLQPTTVNFCDENPNVPETEPSAQIVVTRSILTQQFVDQKVDTSASPAGSSKQQPIESLEGEKLLSSMGLTLMVPKIELVRFDGNASYQPLNELDIKNVELMRLGLVKVKCSPRSSVNSTKAKRKKRVSQRSRRLTPCSKQSIDLSKKSRFSRHKKPVLRQRPSEINLTTDSVTSNDEKYFSSSQLPSDSDRSWQNSTINDHKFPNKLQIRLFDRTPRPEVLTSVPFLENFESDTESMPESVAEDSDKENVTRKRRGRSSKRSRRGTSTKKLRISDCNRRVGASRAKRSEMLEAAEVPTKDLPKTDDAMVLLTEQNKAGGSNMVMYFPRLKLIKSIPDKMADKYYSQAVIDYYRRSMLPQVKVARRSF